MCLLAQASPRSSKPLIACVITLYKMIKEHKRNTCYSYDVALKSLILSSMLLSSGILASSNSENDFCKKYDWGKVEELVEPYLDETDFTSLVMQGLSSEYDTSVAASQAMNHQLPQEIHNTLSRIVKLNCP